MVINSLGLIELRSISRGIKTTDEMLKCADVEIVMSSPHKDLINKLFKKNLLK
jgi:microcompartment protein CcmL/EutN